MRKHSAGKTIGKEPPELKYFNKLDNLLRHLHDVGGERDRAGNRSMQMDQYCMLILLNLFNPVVASLQELQKTGELQKVQKKLACPRASLGSLSESVSVFDPDRIVPILANHSPEALPHTRLLLDSALVGALPSIAMASFRNSQSASTKTLKWTLPAYFQVERNVATQLNVAPTAGGENTRRAEMNQMVESDRLYSMDRGRADYEFLNRIVDLGSSYVCRVRDNSLFTVSKENLSTDIEPTSRVLADQLISLKSIDETVIPRHPVRLLVINAQHRKSAGIHEIGSTGQDNNGILCIVTNLVSVPDRIISHLYLDRWQIEIFYQYFKHLLGCRHLLRYSDNGIGLEVCCAIIACMLITLWTGRKPTLRTHEMIRWYFSGMACDDDLLNHVARLSKPSEPRKRLI
jgi:hypothetical protein